MPDPASIPECDNPVTATDNCDAAPHIDCAFVDTGGPCRHIRTITYTATDSCGNQSTCVQKITWRTDTRDPHFTKCPADVDLGCNPTVQIPGCALTPNNVAATDTCGTPTITCSSVDGGTASSPPRTI